MGRTFNRPPLTVNTPSSSDVKQYFFNQHQWKGLNDNKNFLNVDQETFSDCNNVYVDEQGLLRSRPSLKVKVVTRTNTGVEYVLSNIVDVWTFEYVTVYQTKVDDVYYLTFVNNKVENHIQVPLQYNDNEELKTYKDVKLIVAEEKIFVFSEHSFNYYDMRENIYADATEFVHIPVTTVITDGIVDSKAKVESPNILTSSYITKYLYTSTADLNFNTLVGKDVSVEIDGISYTINFKYNNQIAFVGRYTGLSEYNFADEYILGLHGEGIPLIGASEKQSLIVSSYSYTIEQDSKKPNIAWNIYHTIDGIAFNKLPEITNVIGMPKISRDGNYCFVFKDEGPYVFSLLETDDGIVYSKWTNLLKTINEVEYDSLDLHLNRTNDVGTTFNQSTVVNGYFLDDGAFAFTYGDNLIYKTGDPVYNTLYCVYCKGTGNIYRKQIFYSIATASWSYNPIETSKQTYEMEFNTETTGSGSLNTKFTSNNISDKTFSYTRSDGSTITATATLSNLVYTKQYSNWLGELTWGTATLTGKLSIVDSQGNVIADTDISFSKENYAPITTLSGGTVRYNSWTMNDAYFTYQIKSSSRDIILDPNVPGYRESIIITAKSISGQTEGAGIKLPVDFGAGSYHATTNKRMPNVYASLNADNDKISIAIDFAAELINSAPYSPQYRGIYHIEDGETQTAEVLNYKSYESWQYCRTPIKDSCIIRDRTYLFARLDRSNDAKQNITVNTIVLSDNSDEIANAKINTEVIIFSEPYSNFDFNEQTLVLSDPQGYLLTNKYIFDYLDYTNDNEQYEPISLLFTAKPVAHYYSGNTFDCIYLATNDALYVSNTDKVITVSELTVGLINYLLPDFYAQLENYYISKNNTLYISSPSIELTVNSDASVTKNISTFKWYFPEINKQEFDYNITNLHQISNSTVAIFFEHFVNYVSWDSDISAYRYYKSKLQTGCKSGGDVLTTYDGKYIIFPSERGLVAMTYQEFVATDEQALTYLSDGIYSIFQHYIKEQDSDNEIKLFKYAYWIFVYKQDSNTVFVFDVRNNSWWPMTFADDVGKFVMENDKILLLSNCSMFDFDKNEIEYYDYDGVQHKISWFIQSQKLHLNAVNYYKHIANMTFTSVHDTALLEQSSYNVDSLDFKLQVNNYRKRIDGNINTDDYTTVNYTVNSARTYIQRLNYSKVNEFQYMLSSNEDNAIDIPLSLNSITVKYKVSGQVR